MDTEKPLVYDSIETCSIGAWRKVGKGDLAALMHDSVKFDESHFELLLNARDNIENQLVKKFFLNDWNDYYSKKKQIALMELEGIIGPKHVWAIARALSTELEAKYSETENFAKQKMKVDKIQGFSVPLESTSIDVFYTILTCQES